METNIFLIIFSIAGFATINYKVFEKIDVIKELYWQAQLIMIFIFWGCLIVFGNLLLPSDIFCIITYIGTGILCVYSIVRSLTL